MGTQGGQINRAIGKQCRRAAQWLKIDGRMRTLGEGKSRRRGLPSRHGYSLRPRPAAPQRFIDPGRMEGGPCGQTWDDEPPDFAERRGISIDAVKFHVANALAKLRLPNRKALRHWHQAPLQSPLHQQENIMDSQTRLGPIGQIARSVRNIEEAQTWYSTVLGIPHLYTFGKLAFFDCGGIRLMLTEESKAPSPESILYLRVVQHCRAARANLLGQRRRIHQRAAHDSWQTCGRDRGVARHVQGP